jgi:hypothetical protein
VGEIRREHKWLGTHALNRAGQLLTLRDFTSQIAYLQSEIAHVSLVVSAVGFFSAERHKDVSNSFIGSGRSKGVETTVRSQLLPP